MGIVCELKQISIATVEVLRQDPSLVELFRAAKYLPESAFWRQATYWASDSAEQKRSQEKFERFRWIGKYKQETLKNQFLVEWEIPELDLDKSWSELTFFLAGYIPVYISSWAVPELEKFKTPNPQTSTQQGLFRKLFSPRSFYKQKDFLDFLVIEASEWDGLPLVNAVGAGMGIDYARDYGPMRYLLADETEQVLNGLIKLSEKGLEERFWREAGREEPCSYIDWSDKEDLLEGMIYLYNETLSYYREAVMNQRAMLLYLT